MTTTKQDQDASDIAEVCATLCDAVEAKFHADLKDDPESHAALRRTSPSSLQITFYGDRFSIVIKQEVSGRAR